MGIQAAGLGLKPGSSIRHMGLLVCNRHHVKHSCRLDASDRIVGDILHIPSTAPTAVNACLQPTWGIP
eukprot:6191816-Pleurochrysis_carterae.AAC.1